MQRDQRGVAVTLKLAALSGTFLVFYFALHPSGRTHDFYGTWMRNDGKGSCCNNQDCAPAVAERRGAHWYVSHHGSWLQVPETAVIRQRSPDGRAHACIMNGNVLCFVEPILA
jgi:hypothetical protein